MSQLENSIENFSDGHNGKGFLRVQKAGHKSFVQSQYAQSPLRFLNPKNHGQAAWIYSSSYGGGLVDGDQLDIQIELGEEAEAVLLSQSSMKIYRSPLHSTLGSSQNICAHLAPRSFLASMPDPVVCFAKSSFRQKQIFHLAQDASLLLLDVVVAGRIESDERWVFDRYQNEIRVKREGRDIFFESLLFDSFAGDLARRSGRFNVFGLLLLVGPSLLDSAQSILQNIETEKLPMRTDLALAASPLKGDACVVRFASTSTEELMSLIRQHLSFLPSRLGDDPWQRKW